jgi:hypothetical protein
LSGGHRGAASLGCMTDQEQPEPDGPDEVEDEEMVGDPIPDVFDPTDPAARFVVSMSMARNDIERAFHDLMRSGDEDRQDFTYRVRLLTGHLVEALDALAFYREAFPQRLSGSSWNFGSDPRLTIRR